MTMPSRKGPRMAWYYQILGRQRQVVEESAAIYNSPWEAEWAGYRRFRDNPGVERLIPMAGNILAKRKE